MDTCMFLPMGQRTDGEDLNQESTTRNKSRGRNQKPPPDPIGAPTGNPNYKDPNYIFSELQLVVPKKSEDAD